jgi:hypothetical protein
MFGSALKLNPVPANQGNSVVSALGEVTVAFEHLASALVHKILPDVSAEPEPLTATEEAEQLRTYAADIQAQDPDFAQDLFAAADRHEIEAAATKNQIQPRSERVFNGSNATA